jgi:energy-coupling factor transporter ATP-binding protein EcfA2
MKFSTNQLGLSPTPLWQNSKTACPIHPLLHAEHSRKIVIIAGHYGAGKTTLAVKLAFALKSAGETVTIADLDIVNPYFRTVEHREQLESAGIRLAVSDYAVSSLDVPAVNLDIRGEADRCDRLIIDVGGDGAGSSGAKVLGRFAPVLNEIGYEMIYVINHYRYLTETAEQAVGIMRSIENSSGLKCTMLFNNSNLMGETTAEVIADSVPFAEEVAAITGLPLGDLPAEV